MKNANSLRLKLFCMVLGFVVLPVIAQAPVSDVSTPQRRVEVSDGYDSGHEVSSSARSYGDSEARVGDANAVVSGSESGNLLRQLQQLQEEVGSLRGQLEEQAYEIQKLKQQQDDFASLDRRLGGGSAAASTLPVSSGTNETSPTAPMSSGKPVDAGNNDGKDEYEAAYAKLKGKDYPGATDAFRAFVNKYPNSEYAGNSWFWLGFVYQTQGDIDSASKAFASLVERFPNHAKAEDAKYNLGKIYHQQGKIDQARTLLKEVAAGSSKSAPLAKSYLESM